GGTGGAATREEPAAETGARRQAAAVEWSARSASGLWPSRSQAELGNEKHKKKTAKPSFAAGVPKPSLGTRGVFPSPLAERADHSTAAMRVRTAPYRPAFRGASFTRTRKIGRASCRERV